MPATFIPGRFRGTLPLRDEAHPEAYLITLFELRDVPARTPVVLVANPDGYAVAVGDNLANIRWLSTHPPAVRLFSSADRAIALLNTIGRERFLVELHRGLPQ